MIALAFAGSAPVGIMGCYTEESGAPLLIAAWVDPAARGTGAGDALVAEVLTWSAERGHRRVLLRIADGNDPARKLFLRNGFIPTGERVPLESNPKVHTEIMARELS